MHTKDKLAQALRDIGQPEMADKAAAGYWHDFLSPLTFPQVDLVGRLAALRTPGATKLAAAVMNGEFDASKEEADEWAATPEGKATRRELDRMLNRGKTRH